VKVPRKKRPEEMLAHVRRDRLNKHLNEVEQVIRDWISELSVPSPFAWSESEEAIEFESKEAAMPVRLSIPLPPDYRASSQWKAWACHAVYAPPKEQDPVANHMLRKHLRKRSLWAYHTEWERRLERVMDLTPSVCDKAAQIVDRSGGQLEITEDYRGKALEKALDLAIGRDLERSYFHKPAFSRGVWYDDILIEKSTKTEEVEKVANQHWKVICELAQSEEMGSLAEEWRKVLELQGKMQELATKALKSSDILYPCQFCRRLW